MLVFIVTLQYRRHYFFNIPTHAPIIYTLKNTKFTSKHLKTLKICPYMFRSIF